MDRRTLIERLSLALLTSGALPLCLLRSARASSSTSARKPTIIVDPGHGGMDPGAIGHGGLEEKHVVLDIAEHCATDLAVLSGASVHMTRCSDVFLSLAERVKIAIAHKADLFVSIHADSAPDPDARGLSVYTLAESASDRLSAALARSENSVDTIYGVQLDKLNANVASILVDLACEQSMNLSRAVQHRLIRDLHREVRLLDNPARHANFEVLRNPVPAVLIETAFLSNRWDEMELRSSSFRRRLGSEIARSLSDAFANVLHA